MFIEKQFAMQSSPRRGDIGGRQSVEIGRNGKEQERKRDAIAHQRGVFRLTIVDCRFLIVDFLVDSLNPACVSRKGGRTSLNQEPGLF